MITCGERKTWSNIKKSQNIMTMIVDTRQLFQRILWVLDTGNYNKHFLEHYAVVYYLLFSPEISKCRCDTNIIFCKTLHHITV